LVPTMMSRRVYSNCIDEQRAKTDRVARGQVVLDAAVRTDQSAALRRAVQMAVYAMNDGKPLQQAREAGGLVAVVDGRKVQHGDDMFRPGPHRALKGHLQPQ